MVRWRNLLNNLRVKDLFKAGRIYYGIQELSGSGAANVTSTITELTSTPGSTPSVITLADGGTGQLKILSTVSGTGQVTVTPTNYADGTSIYLGGSGTNSTALLYFDGTNWRSVGQYRPFTIGAAETLTGSGPLSLSTEFSIVTTGTGTGIVSNPITHTVTLADGVLGQKKTIVHTTGTGTSIIVTPANFKEATSIVLALEDSCTLAYMGSNWHFLSGTGSLFI